MPMRTSPRAGAGAVDAAAAAAAAGPRRLWLDPAIQDDPVYAEHWAGHRPVSVTVEPDRIVISRAGEQSDADDGDSDDA